MKAARYLVMLTVGICIAALSSANAQELKAIRLPAPQTEIGLPLMQALMLRRSSRELIRLLGYAQRSCSEVQSQLYRALDCTYITQDQFDKVSASVAECRQQIKGFRKYAQSHSSEKPDAKTPPSQ